MIKFIIVEEQLKVSLLSYQIGTFLNVFIFFRYFVQPFPSLDTWKDEEIFAYNDESAEKIMACNGWVMNDNPLLNFAHYPSQV